LRGVSASEALAPLGKHPYKSRPQWFAEKTRPFDPDAPDPLAGNPNVQRGKFYEDVAAALYERETGAFIFDFGVLSHEHTPWVIGSPDGLTADWRLVEIKCPSRIEHQHVRPYYAAQCQVNMEICGADVCDYVQYDALRHLIDVTVLHRDRDWFARWRQQVEPIWQLVLDVREGRKTMADVPPEFHPRPPRKRIAPPSPPPPSPNTSCSDEDAKNNTICDFID
jgi:putative phage-type endonuclease